MPLQWKWLLQILPQESICLKLWRRKSIIKGQSIRRKRLRWNKSSLFWKKARIRPFTCRSYLMCWWGSGEAKLSGWNMKISIISIAQWRYKGSLASLWGRKRRIMQRRPWPSRRLKSRPNPAIELYRFRIMCLKQYWKKRNSMKNIRTGGSGSFRI